VTPALADVRDSGQIRGCQTKVRTIKFEIFQCVVFLNGSAKSSEALISQMVTKLEFPMVDRDNITPHHAQEIEYALILARMISVAEGDPAQMRTMVYELARAKLKIDMARSIDISRAGDGERKRLATALETAIQGVEVFTKRQDAQPMLPSLSSRQIGPLRSEPEPATAVPVYRMESKTGLVREVFAPSDLPPILDMRARVWVSPLGKILVGVLFTCMAAGLMLYRQRIPELMAMLSPPAKVSTAPSAAPSLPVSQERPAGVEPKTAAFGSLPLPSDYGVYVVSNGALNELHLMGIQVPDKRIAMSTPLSGASRTTVPDGKAKFVIYRRDLANSAPDRIEVRVIARVARAIKFDTSGKPVFSPVSDTWNIRNLSYELRVRPIPGNPEMLLVQAENPDFVLPSGRYALVLKNEGYDFMVAGNVTDPGHCLEQTEAANGIFYSDCQK
jgi:hypothetical protein